MLESVCVEYWRWDKGKLDPRSICAAASLRQSPTMGLVRVKIKWFMHELHTAILVITLIQSQLIGKM